MTHDPIDLDGRRTQAGRRATEVRRRLANDDPSLGVLAPARLGSLEDQMLAEPAQTWGEVMQKWRFLLERYSASPAARDERIQKLIRQAIGDMERLRKREKRK